MTQTEIAVLQHDAALFKQYRAENAKLRAALGEKTAADRKMALEDAAAIKMVTDNRSRANLLLLAVQQEQATEAATDDDGYADFDLDEAEVPAEPRMGLGWRILLSAALGVLIWFPRLMRWVHVLTRISILFAVLLLFGAIR